MTAHQRKVSEAKKLKEFKKSQKTVKEQKRIQEKERVSKKEREEKRAVTDVIKYLVTTVVNREKEEAKALRQEANEKKREAKRLKKDLQNSGKTPQWQKSAKSKKLEFQLAMMEQLDLELHGASDRGSVKKRGGGRQAREAQASEAEELLCICKQPADDNRDWVGCELCEDWFHYECVDWSDERTCNGDYYWCSKCEGARYSAKDDETPTGIAKSTGCNLMELVALNKKFRLPGLNKVSKLMPDTHLLLPHKNPDLERKLLGGYSLAELIEVDPLFCLDQRARAKRLKEDPSLEAQPISIEPDGKVAPKPKKKSAPKGLPLIVGITAGAKKRVKDQQTKASVSLTAPGLPGPKPSPSEGASKKKRKRQDAPEDLPALSDVARSAARPAPRKKHKVRSWESPLLEMAILTRAIFRDDRSEPFLEPVSLHDYPDYKRVVKLPMDFSKIAQLVADGHYPSIDAFATDVELVQRNCITFNAPESDIAYMINDVLREFKELRYIHLLRVDCVNRRLVYVIV